MTKILGNRSIGIVQHRRPTFLLDPLDPIVQCLCTFSCSVWTCMHCPDVCCLSDGQCAAGSPGFVWSGRGTFARSVHLGRYVSVRQLDCEYDQADLDTLLICT